MQAKSMARVDTDNLLPPKNDQLSRAVSDVSTEMNKIFKDFNIAMEVEKAECECCGLHEDCTPDYIGHIKDQNCGKWVCGLCSEAVKERLERAPSTTPMKEAVDSHMALCKNFNRIRLNPKLSLAGAMRDIVKRSSQCRTSNNCNMPRKITRTSSCDPRIGVDVDRLN